MKSTASVMDHPIHPMLIPYPFAFLTGAAAFDVASATTGNERLSQTASHLSTAGMVTALAAALPGVIDYATTVPAGSARQTATVHMVSNVSGLLCFAAASVQRREGPASGGVLALELAGTVLLALGGWLGGKLVYHHQIGVDPEEQRPRELATDERYLSENRMLQT